VRASLQPPRRSDTRHLRYDGQRARLSVGYPAIGGNLDSVTTQQRYCFAVSAQGAAIADGRSAISGNFFSSQDDKCPRGRIVLQHQARRGKPFEQGMDCHLAVDESRQINRGLRCCNSGTRSPWDDLCTHDASSARLAWFQMIPMSATRHITEADQVIVAMASMGESVLVRVLARQCRRSWKKSPTCDFSQESLALRCDHPSAPRKRH
jgi:hypothetical protein